MKISIHDDDKIIALLKEKKMQPYRYTQIENAIYKNFITNFDDIQTIPKDLRNFLNENCFYSTLEVDHTIT
jgi:adenine C2-methylase RlmN of 23S rRNA A2503 and tRNA A37